MISRRNAPWLVFGVFTLLYYLCFIFRTAVWVNDRYYFCLFDDAMISMSYAKNLVEGYGLNWAKYGSPVEGYTNPLWTFLMIPLHVLPIPVYYTSLVFQLFCAAILFACFRFMFLIVKYLKPDLEQWMIALPILFTAFFYPLVNWSLYGMETSLSLLFGLISIYHSFKFKELQQWKDLRIIAIVGSLSVFLRYDLIIIPFLSFVYLAPELIKKYKQLFMCVLIVVVPNLIYLVFRYLYFEDWLPNTYYLKMTGMESSDRIKRGWEVFYSGFHTFRIPFLMCIGYIVYRKDLKLFYILSFWILYSFYAIYVGGDAWEYIFTDGYNRFQSVALPMLFIVLSIVIFDLINFLHNRFQNFKPLKYLLFVTLSWFFITDFNHLTKLPSNNFNWRRALLLERPMHMTEHDVVVNNVLKMNRVAGPEDKVAVVWAGIPGYFGNFQLVDILGYNDKYIAKLPNNPEAMKWYKFYYPGHMKWDYNYTLNQLNPKYVLHFWSTNHDELVRNFPYVRKDFYWERNQ